MASRQAGDCGIFPQWVCFHLFCNIHPDFFTGISCMRKKHNVISYLFYTGFTLENQASGYVFSPQK